MQEQTDKSLENFSNDMLQRMKQDRQRVLAIAKDNIVRSRCLGYIQMIDVELARRGGDYLRGDVATETIEEYDIRVQEEAKRRRNKLVEKLDEKGDKHLSSYWRADIQKELKGLTDEALTERLERESERMGTAIDVDHPDTARDAQHYVELCYAEQNRRVVEKARNWKNELDQDELNTLRWCLDNGNSDEWDVCDKLVAKLANFLSSLTALGGL